MDEFDRLLTPRTKMVAVAARVERARHGQSVARSSALARKAGAAVLIDGSQAVQHMPVDVQALGADFYVFTGHKLYGPTGIGVLYGREAVLEAMPPFLGGGDMIRTVTFEGSTWNDLPYKFEAGTPDIAGASGSTRRFDYVTAIGFDAIGAHEARAAADGDRRAVARCPASRIVGTRAPEGGVAVVRDGRHPSARHRHDRRSRRRGDSHGPSLRAAGHGSLRHSGDRACVVRDVQHAGRCRRARRARSSASAR